MMQMKEMILHQTLTNTVPQWLCVEPADQHWMVYTSPYGDWAGPVCFVLL